MKKVFTVYVSPLEMGSTAHRLVDLPMEQEKLDTLILELNTGQPLYTEVSDYITIGADETAQTYEARQKRTYWTIAGVSAAYLLVWLAVNGLLLYKRRKAGETE